MAWLLQEAFSRAVLDTGPLFTALSLDYVRTRRVPEPKRTHLLNTALQPYLRDDARRQELYLKRFRSIRSLLTTSHVIGELHGLSKRLRLGENDRKYFWLHVMVTLAGRNLEEELVRLLDLYGRDDLREPACLFGPTDVGLMDLAKRTGCVLLTEDRGLNNLARRSNVICYLLDEWLSS